MNKNTSRRNCSKIDKKEYIVKSVFDDESDVDINEIFKQSFLLKMKGENW